MANFTCITVTKGVIDPTDNVDKIKVDYDDGTQKTLLSNTDVSGESDVIKDIHTTFFS
jgi:hypothetical protein